MYYVIAGHGRYPQSVKDTIEFLAGPHGNLICVEEKDGNNDYQPKIDELAARGKDVIIFTDLVEGAINQYCTRKLVEGATFRLLSGFSICLVLELVLREEVSDEEIERIVEEARQQMVYVNDIVKLHD